MKEKYEEELKKAVRENREVPNVLKQDERGRPFLLGKEVQNYLKNVRLRGGQIVFAIANATAEALKNNPEYNLNMLDLRSSFWAQSLFRGMVTRSGQLQLER